MVRYVIALTKYDDEIVITVERDGKLYDEVSFHLSERVEAVRYVSELARRVVADV